MSSTRMPSNSIPSTRMPYVPLNFLQQYFFLLSLFQFQIWSYGQFFQLSSLTAEPAQRGNSLYRQAQATRILDPCGDLTLKKSKL